jgi:hypothetical protein
MGHVRFRSQSGRLLRTFGISPQADIFAARNGPIMLAKCSYYALGSARPSQSRRIEEAGVPHCSLSRPTRDLSKSKSELRDHSDGVPSSSSFCVNRCSAPHVDRRRTAPRRCLASCGSWECRSRGRRAVISHCWVCRATQRLRSIRRPKTEIKEALAGLFRPRPSRRRVVKRSRFATRRNTTRCVTSRPAT